MNDKTEKRHLYMRISALITAKGRNLNGFKPEFEWYQETKRLWKKHKKELFEGC